MKKFLILGFIFCTTFLLTAMCSFAGPEEVDIPYIEKVFAASVCGNGTEARKYLQNAYEDEASLKAFYANIATYASENKLDNFNTIYNAKSKSDNLSEVIKNTPASYFNSEEMKNLFDNEEKFKNMQQQGPNELAALNNSEEVINEAKGYSDGGSGEVGAVDYSGGLVVVDDENGNGGNGGNGDKATRRQKAYSAVWFDR